MNTPASRPIVKILRTSLRIVFAAGLVWLVYYLRANRFIRAYPLAVVSIALFLFSRSLFTTPLAERIARGMGETLDEDGVRYCRLVTRAWVVFLSLHFLLTAATLFLSREVWAWYNGCVSYVLFGLMFAGEYCARIRYRRLHGRNS